MFVVGYVILLTLSQSSCLFYEAALYISSLQLCCPNNKKPRWTIWNVKCFTESVFLNSKWWPLDIICARMKFKVERVNFKSIRLSNDTRLQSTAGTETRKTVNLHFALLANHNWVFCHQEWQLLRAFFCFAFASLDFEFSERHCKPPEPHSYVFETITTTREKKSWDACAVGTLLQHCNHNIL